MDKVRIELSRDNQIEIALTPNEAQALLCAAHGRNLFEGQKSIMKQLAYKLSRAIAALNILEDHTNA